MEVLWNIDGGIMEKLRNLYVSFMEKILDWNVEKLWSICGESQMWSICGESQMWSICGESQMWSICVESTHWKITDWKISKRDTME